MVRGAAYQADIVGAASPFPGRAGCNSAPKLDSKEEVRVRCRAYYFIFFLMHRIILCLELVLVGAAVPLYAWNICLTVLSASTSAVCQQCAPSFCIPTESRRGSQSSVLYPLTNTLSAWPSHRALENPDFLGHFS